MSARMLRMLHLEDAGATSFVPLSISTGTVLSVSMVACAGRHIERRQSMEEIKVNPSNPNALAGPTNATQAAPSNGPSNWLACWLSSLSALAEERSAPGTSCGGIDW